MLVFQKQLKQASFLLLIYSLKEPEHRVPLGPCTTLHSLVGRTSALFPSSPKPIIIEVQLGTRSRPAYSPSHIRSLLHCLHLLLTPTSPRYCTWPAPPSLAGPSEVQTAISLEPL